MTDWTSPPRSNSTTCMLRSAATVCSRAWTCKFKPGFNGLIGPNGAGKTTVFNVLVGLRQANTGDVRLAGEDLAGMSRLAGSQPGLPARSNRQSSSSTPR